MIIAITVVIIIIIILLLLIIKINNNINNTCNVRLCLKVLSYRFSLMSLGFDSKTNDQ